jgi:hypothetical protein
LSDREIRTGTDKERRIAVSVMSRRSVVLSGVLFVVLLSVAPITKVDAIDPGDGLHHGQELVDWATSLIDARVAEIRRGPQDGETLYGEIRGLVQWVPTYAESKIAPQYRLEGPSGLMIQDAISDTLATRLHGVLAEYVKQNPDEILDRGREAFEIATSRVSLPPGRLLGFHLVHMAGLYVAGDAGSCPARGKRRLPAPSVGSVPDPRADPRDGGGEVLLSHVSGRLDCSADPLREVWSQRL